MAKKKLPPIPQPDFKYKGSEGIKKSALFHGTSKNFAANKIKPSTMGLMGHGTYLTDDPSVAKTYARPSLTHPRKLKQSGPIGSPSVKSFMLSPDANLIDMQKPLTPDVEKVFNKHIERLSESSDELFKVSSKDTGWEAMKKFQTAVSESDVLYRYEAEEFFADLSFDLKNKGYDGLTHLGGVATGNKKHNVAVMFDPEELGLEAAKVKMKNIKTKAADVLADGTILPKKISKKLGKGLKGIPVIGPLIAGGIAYATSGGDVNAAMDILAEDFGGKLGEGSDKFPSDDGFRFYEQEAKTLDQASRDIMRDPSSEQDDMTKLRAVLNDPETFKKLHPTDRMRLRLKVEGHDSLAGDKAVMEEVNALANIFETRPDLNVQRGTVDPKEHKEITKRTAGRKKQFEKARSLSEDSPREALIQMQDFTKLLQQDESMTPTQKRQEHKSMQKQLQNETMQKFKEGTNILKNLATGKQVEG